MACKYGRISLLTRSSQHRRFAERHGKPKRVRVFGTWKQINRKREMGREKNLLKKLNPRKANGPDLIPSRVLKECAPQIAPYLTIIFNQSLSEQQLPKDWLTANICPVFKKGARSTASNYRPISLTCVICKTMEHILYHHIMAHLEQLNILKDYQHGFRKGRSCETQLIITVDEIAKSLDNRSQVDLLILDFSKAFDTVPHARLL